MNYGSAAVIGAVSGFRSLAAPAVVTTRLGSERAAHIVQALAVGELIADKLPFMPDRTKPVSLTFRAVSGAACGYAIASSKGKHPREREKWISAAIGGAAALAASYAGFEFRKRVRLPRLLSAFIEDAVTVAAGAAVAAAIGR
jgi:uncharacterized membrane protein